MSQPLKGLEMAPNVKQLVVQEKLFIDPNKTIEHAALFDTDGNPFTGAGPDTLLFDANPVDLVIPAGQIMKKFHFGSGDLKDGERIHIRVAGVTTAADTVKLIGVTADGLGPGLLGVVPIAADSDDNEFRFDFFGIRLGGFIYGWYDGAAGLFQSGYTGGLDGETTGFGALGIEPEDIDSFDITLIGVAADGDPGDITINLFSIDKYPVPGNLYSDLNQLSTDQFDRVDIDSEVGGDFTTGEIVLGIKDEQVYMPAQGAGEGGPTGYAHYDMNTYKNVYSEIEVAELPDEDETLYLSHCCASNGADAELLVVIGQNGAAQATSIDSDPFDFTVSAGDVLRMEARVNPVNNGAVRLYRNNNLLWSESGISFGGNTEFRMAINRGVDEDGLCRLDNWAFGLL